MQWRVSDIDRGRTIEGAAFACCAILAAIGIWLIVRLVWILVPRADDALFTSTTRIGADAGPAPAQSVSKWHLFGNTPLKPGADGAPATTLSMILRGTVSDGNPLTGMAVISDGERGERAFRAGESLAQGVTLARVYADHIVLLHDGAEETLKLPRDQNFAPADIVRAAPAKGVRGNNPSATGTNAPAESTAANAPAAKTPSDLQQTMERLRQNPDELARRVQIVPVLDNGKLNGVRISAGTDIALMNRIGLQPGDVVTAVNGAPVDSIARGQQIMDSLRSAASARVTVVRNGKPTDITISLK